MGILLKTILEQVEYNFDLANLVFSIKITNELQKKIISRKPDIDKIKEVLARKYNVDQNLIKVIFLKKIENVSKLSFEDLLKRFDNEKDILKYI